jgi:protein involved in polysaccharide export with SLBB domain
LAGVQDTDVRLKPRDVLTIRQLAGWNTVGTVVHVAGEVNYPGTYGIVEGEHLSSVLRRAGGFRAGAFPQGAVLTRDEVKRMNEKAREALILRVQSMVPDIKAGPSETPALVAAAHAQQEQMVKRLKETPIVGRQVISISADISKWENTQADVEVRPGDSIFIPKYPTFVAVQGQVNSPSAITYMPGEKASWYFKRAGGATSSADQKNVFIVRADGSVVGKGSSSGFWDGGVMSTVLRPGDTLVVPEKIITGSSTFRVVMQTIQTMSQVALTAGVFANF